MTTISGLDVWSLISGVIGIFGVLPFIWAYVRSQHPETKLAELDSTLNNTEALLRSVIEEGLLHPVNHVPHFELHLKKFHVVTEKLRDDTFIASVEWRKLLRAWYNGLSKDISTVCTQVKGVRADICETSANARMRLTREHTDDPLPYSFHHRLRAKVIEFWKCVVSFGRRNSRVRTVDAAGSITPAPSTSDTVLASAECARAETLVPEDTPTPDSDSDVRRCLPPSRKTSAGRTKATHASPHVPCTAAGKRKLLVFSRAIRQVDRELAAEGVTNARLAHLVQATHKQWSPASSKAQSSRRSRKQAHRPMPRSNHGIPLRRASEPDIDSDADSSDKETMCEV